MLACAKLSLGPTRWYSGVREGVNPEGNDLVPGFACLAYAVRRHCHSSRKGARAKTMQPPRCDHRNIHTQCNRVSVTIALFLNAVKYPD